VILCPNCGTANEPGSRFCAECGADLRSLASTQPEPPLAPPPPTNVPYQPAAPQPGGWQMASGPPPEPPKQRRVWLWIVVGVISACVLFCCGVTVWASTDPGADFFGDVGTRIADELTEAAPTPTRER
jgi:hypothetical protein